MAVTATNGSMASFLAEQNMEVSENQVNSATTGVVPTVIPLKRKLNRDPIKGIGQPDSNDEGSETKRRKSGRISSGTDSQNDCFCWICHKEGDVICCETCPRVFHLKCIQMDTAPTDEWVCPECILMMTAENMDTRSRAMRLSTVDQ